MVYLLAVMLTAVQCGRGPTTLNALLSVLAFDFCFVPPRWSFTVADASCVVTFAVMFLVAMVIGHSTSLIKRQAEAANLQERQTAATHALSRDLASTRGTEKLLQVAVRHISAIFQCAVVALLPDEGRRLRVVAGDMDAVFRQHMLKEMSVAQRAHQEGRFRRLGNPGPRRQPEPVRAVAGGRRHVGRAGTAARGS
jgi:two-component system, OmpR family, sensor histidine kinase KdpD